jgi:hypothetical protein
VQTTGTTIVDTAPPASEAIASPRLAELVIHLTDCNPRLAVAAVDAAGGGSVTGGADDRLATVARALISVRRTIDLREPKQAAPPT